jgi:hypothetical protein
VERADPHIGLLHRGTEKLIEYKTYLQVGRGSSSGSVVAAAAAGFAACLGGRCLAGRTSASTGCVVQGCSSTSRHVSLRAC